MIRRFSLLFFVIQISIFTLAQAPQKPNSSEIYESLQKLNFLGSVLYVAAHPDDENTQLISYFSNDLHARTAYIAMTRGDGGQNLIGPELRELLGVIRTQELLQARKTDGGIQYFTRANDFGFSKTPDETFKFWNKEEVLSDLVFVIRKFQPDIIINRFDARTPGTNHGHHTASAMLSLEAFDLAGNPKSFPKQLNLTKIWQPKKLFFNDSWFFYPNKEVFERADHSKMFSLDMGSYYPDLGLSNSEIAAKSRSWHRSQGFGTTAVRGNAVEYLEPLRGKMPEKNIFEGIDVSWNRVKGGKEIGLLIASIIKSYDFKNPSASVPMLMKAYSLIQGLGDSHWKEIKTQEIKNIIAACSGLFLEAVSSSPTAVAGKEIDIKFEAINRSPLDIKLKNVLINKESFSYSSVLENNKRVFFDKKLRIPTLQEPTSPYWLTETGSIGMYSVSNPALIGLPEAPSPFIATFEMTINGESISFEKPLVYKFNNPAKGEEYIPFSIVPTASVSIPEKVILFNNSDAKEVEVKVKSFTDNLSGLLSLQLPKEWKISPETQSVNIAKKDETQVYRFQVKPPLGEANATMIPRLTIGSEVFEKELVEINYEHIPQQKVLLPAISKMVKTDIIKKGNTLGYINGAGDSVADNLKQIGYDVEILNPENISLENLQKYDAIVLGIRAFNVLPELKYKNEILFDYVKNGGNLVVQYNVSRSMVTDKIAPFPLRLSADRVTEEDAVVKFLAPNNPVLNTPNKITEKDFEGWVQERGLYFPDKWDVAFTPVLSMHDTNEPPLDSSLLVAQYGKGYYIYTGLSFFRELPAGVPGAYRLFANFLSLGK